jgi:putative flippase GtrA
MTVENERKSKKYLAVQTIKFGLVGLLNTLIGYGVFFIFLSWVPYIYALFVANIIGASNSFFWNKYWTFKSKNKYHAEILRFVLVYTFTFIINAMLLSLAISKYHINAKIAQAFILILVTLISFFGHKYWSFRKDNELADE